MYKTYIVYYRYVKREILKAEFNFVRKLSI